MNASLMRVLVIKKEEKKLCFKISSTNHNLNKNNLNTNS